MMEEREFEGWRRRRMENDGNGKKEGRQAGCLKYQ
jgi:hypothetical protein